MFQFRIIKAINHTLFLDLLRRKCDNKLNDWNYFHLLKFGKCGSLLANFTVEMYDPTDNIKNL
jgi:hypothetical protein